MFTCEKKFYKALCGSRGGCTKSDKLPQVMALESASVGAEEFGNEKNLGVSWKEVSLPDVCSPLLIFA